MSVLNRLISRLGLQRIPAKMDTLPGEEQTSQTSEIGLRTTAENQLKYIYSYMWVDPALRSMILDIRLMDREDPRVKKIHGRTARSIVKGGLLLDTTSSNKRIIKAWKDFARRLGLKNQQKLESDARGFIMEGNLPVQWVINQNNRVSAGVRMPTETLRPAVGENGVFKNPAQAYEQFDLTTGVVRSEFALWQLTMGRLSPDNYDDWGSAGRPLLDACRQKYLQIKMTEKDLVVRRHVRAPLRLAHVLEGADKATLDDYEAKIYNDQNDVVTDFFLNKKGGVTPVQGDANLEQIADVVYLLDSFFSGSPLPKGLAGYTEGLNRDILEDIKRDFFEEIDALQDTLSWVYEQGFKLDLLLQGINPETYEFTVKFAERRTDSQNQRLDAALKKQALGYPKEDVWRTAGDDPAAIIAQKKAEEKNKDVYGDFDDDRDLDKPQPRVSVTPGNERKGDSATTISTRG